VVEVRAVGRWLLLGACCVVAASIDAMADQPPRPPGIPAGPQPGTVTPLAVRIEFDGSRKPPSIDVDNTFRVVVKNTSEKPLSIFSPTRQEGYYQLRIHFRNLRSGAKSVARKRKIDDPKFFRELASSTDADSIRLRIEPHSEIRLPVQFGEIAWDGPAWTGVPDPNTAARFVVQAVLESSESRPEADGANNNPAVWTGEARSPEVIAMLVAAQIKTPHQYLCNGFPNRAIELMKADHGWISRVDEEKCTPLHHAARFGHVDAVKWLLANGADVNATARNGFTPLHFAEDRDTIALILRKHPDLSICEQGLGQTPAQRAATEFDEARNEAERRKWREILALYAAASGGGDVLTAVKLDNLARVKEILAASSQWLDNFENESLLRTAAALGQLETCRFLIEKFHVDVNDFDRGNGFPILMEALAHPDVVRLLIDKGADLKKRITFRGFGTGVRFVGDDATLLHYAAKDGAPETIQLLMDHGVDIFAAAYLPFDRQDQTALDVAALFGKADNAIAILDHPNYQRGNADFRKRVLNRCLVSGAAGSYVGDPVSQRPKLIEALLKRGADPNTKEKGITAIMAAAQDVWPQHEQNQELRDEIVILIRHGASLDLYSAVALGDEKRVAQFLAKNPSAANARDARGYPAIDLAIAMNDRDMVNRLLSSDCDVEIRNHAKYIGDRDGTPLNEAAFWGRYAIVKDLIEKGAKVNAAARNKWTPLHNAAYMHCAEVARFLLEHGAQADAKTSDGATPLDLARGNTHGDSADVGGLLIKYQSHGSKPSAK
jgi:ankyrin repeat protein